MNFWEFLDNQDIIFKGILGLGLFLLIWIIIKKDIKGKWFSMKKHDRRQEARKNPEWRKKQ